MSTVLGMRQVRHFKYQGSLVLERLLGKKINYRLLLKIKEMTIKPLWLEHTIRGKHNPSVRIDLSSGRHLLPRMGWAAAASRTLAGCCLLAIILTQKTKMGDFWSFLEKGINLLNRQIFGKLLKIGEWDTFFIWDIIRIWSTNACYYSWKSLQHDKYKLLNLT